MLSALFLTWLFSDPTMTTTTLYGIKNCDTVKKARTWLESNDISFTFHDFRADGLAQKDVELWQQAVGKDALINKRSTTWKQLSDKQRTSFDGETLSADAMALVLDNPTLIKRPVLHSDKGTQVGFKADNYTSYFK